MKAPTILFGLALLFAVSVVDSRPVAAQDCGIYCGPCAAGQSEGYSYHPNGEYNMDCVVAETGCDRCWDFDRSSAVVGGDDAIFALAQRVGAEGLRETLGVEFERLLVHPERNLIGLLGRDCAPDLVVAVAFVTPERMKELQAMGIARLDRYIQNHVTQ